MLRTRAFMVAASVFVVATAGGSALGSETAERTRSIEIPLGQAKALRVDNLIGSVRIEGTSTPGAIQVQATIVAEAKTASEAARLADSVTIDTSSGAGGAVVRAVLPLDGLDALRAPREGKNPVTRFVGTMFHKRGDVEATYQGRTVKITSKGDAAGLVVLLLLKVPFATAVSVRQNFGTVEVAAARGDVRLEVAHGKAGVSHLSGSLEVASEDAEVNVASLQGERLGIATASGGVKLLDVRTKKTELRTASGPIEGERVTANDLAVETADGPVSFSEADAVTASVRTGSGDVDLAALLNRSRGAVIRSDSGNVVLRVGRVIGFDLVAESRSGEVKALGFPLSVVEKNGNVSRLRYGAGGPSLEVRAGAGSVTVRPAGVSRLDLLMGNTGS